MPKKGIEPASDLTRQIAAQLGGTLGIFDWGNSAVPADYAQFAPDVFAAGAKGDVCALRLLQSGAEYIEKGLNALGYQPGNVLSLAGGVGPHYQPYLSSQYTTHLVAPKGNALQGAFSLARALVS